MNATISKTNTGRYAIFAGVSKLSKTFRTAEAAREELENNEALYRVRAGGMTASLHNKMARGDYREAVA